MRKQLIILILFVLLWACAHPGNAFAQVPSTTSADTIDTSGHTRLKQFSTLYGSYLGILTPVSIEPDEATPFVIGLMAGPAIGLMGASSYTATHSFSLGDATALSSLTWFGSMQGHLWDAALASDSETHVVAGVAGSLAGFLAGMSLTGAHDFTPGHAASLGAGNWWGSAMGHLLARTHQNADRNEKALGAALGGAVGLTMGAAFGRHTTHDEIRYLHIGGVLGWLYATGIAELQDQTETNAALTRFVGIGVGTTAGLLASKYKPWHADLRPDLDRSGRMRAQVFAMTYGGYLATAIPMAADNDFWEDDTKDTYTLAYMHAPPSLLLATTYFTRNVNVSKVDAMSLSGLTWFGAMQGGLWASSHKDAESRDVALSSLLGSAAGLLAGVSVTRYDLSDAQSAMLGAGNWWGTVLGTFAGGALLSDDAESEDLAAAAAIGGVAGVVLGSQIGRNMKLQNVSTMHIGGLAGFVIGLGVLVGGAASDSRTANVVLGISTLAGLAAGAQSGLGVIQERADRTIDPIPYFTYRHGLDGEKQKVIGFSVRY